MRCLMEHVPSDDVMIKSKSSPWRLRGFTCWSQLGEEQHKKEFKEKITIFFHLQPFLKINSVK